jgi:hypothetical protein
MRRRSTPALTIVIFVATATAIAVGAFYFGKEDAETPRPPTTPEQITVHPDVIRTVPDHVGAKTRRAAAEDIGDALRSVYRAAFMRSPRSAPSPASPSPSVARRLRDYMTKDATAAVKKSPDVFDIGALVVTHGSVTFDGAVTFDGKQATGALLSVDFIGRATPISRSTPVARVHQKGSISMRWSSGRWLVDGFELRLATRPEPTPTPTAPPV